nr:glycoside hydrolase family 43 protein [uncultured Carboxylicivirga sp.]
MKNLLTYSLIIVLMFIHSMNASPTSLSKDEVETLYNNYFNTSPYNYVTVHDPSIVIGYQYGSIITGEYSEGATKVYYIFGSHRAWARSNDLKNWETFTNNINSSYQTLLAEPATWSAKGSSNYNLDGNMWAPDVIWNTDMQKWCMYMSINGDYWYSSIVLLTAESLNGDWTYEGPVVYSGFSNQTEAEETDFYSVINPSEEFPSRYLLNRNGNRTYGQNAIDPGVFYDEDGTLWMAYGSWFGGIYILQLDGETGLRDYTITYQTNNGTASNATIDAYQGIKVAGGNHVSGEGVYMQNINNTYYMFVTNGALTAAGGYNMRVFASDSPTGPYTDMTNQDARYLPNNTGAGAINGTVGLRLMSYYKWGWMDYGYTAQGHNSAIVDDDGKSYLVYHTRFDNGTEGHQVRVHQLFQAKNGYITVAPFEYSGETLTTGPYSTDKIVGSYSILYHGYGTDYSKLECVKEEEIVLHTDGSVSGAYSGSWSQEADGPYINLSINNTNFKGVFVEQKMEGLNHTTLCFTAVGNDMSVYGYKMAGAGKPFPENATVAYNAYNFNGTVPSLAYKGTKLSLPTQGYYNASYSWSWDETLIDENGIILDLLTDTSTDLELTITCGEYTYTTSISIELIAMSIEEMLPIEEDAVLAKYNNVNEFAAATPSAKINNKTGLSLSFYIENINSDWDLIAHSTDNSYRMLLSVLHFNGADFYEGAATLSPAAIEAGYVAGTAWQIFLHSSCYVTISYNTDGSIAYYKDGILMLTYQPTLSPNYGSGVTPADIAAAVTSYYRNHQLIFDYDVSNIVVGYAADLDLSTYEPIDVSEYAFYEDYDYVGSISSWISPNGSLSTQYNPTLETNSIQLTTGGGSGNRSAYNNFTNVSHLTNYHFSIDVCLTPGNINDRSESEVAIISTDNNSQNNSFSGTGYIFKLLTPTYNGSNGSTWYVNGSSSTALTITPGTWVTINGDVNIINKTATVTIINKTTESTIYNATTNVSGNGILKGLWILTGRGVGTISVDNIKVKNNDVNTGIEKPTDKIDYNLDVEIYNITGVQIYKGKLQTINVPIGIYIVRQGNKVEKMLLKSR